MASLKRMAGMLAGLVVDDGLLAALAVAWVLVATLLLPAVLPGDGARALLLFVGLAAALLASALRRAGRAGS